MRMPLRRVPLLILLWIQWVSPVGSERQFEIGSVLAASGLLDDVGLDAVFVGAGHDNDEDNRHDSEIGSMSSLISIFGTGLTTHAFEANSEACDRENEAIAARPVEQRISTERCHPYAVADVQADNVPFYVTGSPLCNSLYPPNVPVMERFGFITDTFPCGVLERVVHMSTTTLDHLLSPHSISYARLDVQGADLRVLKGGRKALGSVLALQIEVEFVPLYVGQPLFAEVDEYVRNELGLTFMGFTDESYQHRSRERSPMHGLKRQLVHADAIYMRDVVADGSSGAPFEVSTLVRAAGLAAAYGFTDVAVEVLDHMVRRGPAVPECARLGAAFALEITGSWAKAMLEERPGVDTGGVQHSAGAAYEEAEVLLQRESAALARCTEDRLSDLDPAATAPVVVMYPTGQSADLTVALAKGEEPRKRAAAFCRTHHFPFGECVAHVANRLIEGVEKTPPLL